MKKLENILEENMHRFGTKNLNEDADQNNNGYPDKLEGKVHTIVYKTSTGYERQLDLDLTQFDNFLSSLKPLIGRSYEITPDRRKDIISYIVNHLGGYGALGGGTINII